MRDVLRKKASLCDEMSLIQTKSEQGLMLSACSDNHKKEKNIKKSVDTRGTV